MSNIKAGDLCLLIRNTMSKACIESLVGSTIVQVTKSCVGLTLLRLAPRVYASRCADAWKYQGPLLRCACGNPIELFFDADLTPLRDSDEPDEMVRLLGKASELPIYTSVTTEVSR